MSYFKKQLELLEYLNKPLSIESIDLLYNANNVRYENTLVYSDFSVSLITLIFNTYLGDDITSEDERVNHFNWCWDKTNANFMKEQINLHLSDNLKKSYFESVNISFYQNQDKEFENKLMVNNIRYWKELFDIQTTKSRAEVDIFLEMYKQFNHNLFNKKTK